MARANFTLSIKDLPRFRLLMHEMHRLIFELRERNADSTSLEREISGRLEHMIDRCFAADSGDQPDPPEQEPLDDRAS